MRGKQKRKKHSPAKKRVLIVTLGVLAAFAIFSALVMWRYARQTSKDNEIIGVSFSQVQAERHGVDWRQNYEAILNDLQPRQVRLAAYWNRIEKSPGQYDFSETDWMIERTRAKDTKVTLVIGQKVIRWPECFYPSWLDKNNPDTTGQAATKLVKATVEHYKNDPTIDTWQLENEFFLKVFGECPRQNLTRKQLQNELDALRSIDGERPVMLSASNNYGLPIRGPFGGVYGFSMYKRVWNPQLGYFVYTYPALWSWWRAAMINLFFGQEIRIHELQAEAWGPTGNEKLDYQEAQKSMNPQYLNDIINWARGTKIKRFDLWGAEWWYDQKVHHNNPQMWEAARAIIHESKQRR